MSKVRSFRDTASFLFEIGSMRKLARAHRQGLLTDDLSDNIASHSFRVAWIGWILAHKEGVDPAKVLLMCLSHDISEARGGDQNWVNKKYVKVFEEEITNDQTNLLEDGKELAKIIEEYRERKTKESIVAKDADIIDQILLLKEYTQAGNKGAQEWIGNGKNNRHFKLIKTKSGVELARAIIAYNHSDWYKDISTDKRR